MPVWKRMRKEKKPMANESFLIIDEKTLTEEDWEDLVEEVNFLAKTEEQD